MITENPLWALSTSEECEDPPSYEAAVWLQQHQLSRVTLIEISGYDLPPSYEEACYPELHQIRFTRQVLAAQQNEFQITNNAAINFNRNNFAANFAQSRNNLFYAALPDRIFSDSCKRQVFVRNVYGIVSIQLLTITLHLIIASQSPEEESRHRDTNISVALIITCFVFPTFVIIACCPCCFTKSKSRSSNIFRLVVHTLYIASFLAILSVFLREKILLSAITTTIACVSLTVFATNFATCGGILLVIGVISGIFPFLMLAFPFSHVVYACLAAVIFSTFLVHDTQLMVIGKHRQSASITWQDYIFAVHTFHMDIILTIPILFLITVISCLWLFSKFRIV